MLIGSRPAVRGKQSPAAYRRQGDLWQARRALLYQEASGAQ
ncbi:hypothetical protein [Streptomyces sp. CA-106131]